MVIYFLEVTSNLCSIKWWLQLLTNGDQPGQGECSYIVCVLVSEEEIRLAESNTMVCLRSGLKLSLEVQLRADMADQRQLYRAHCCWDLELQSAAGLSSNSIQTERHDKETDWGKEVTMLQWVERHWYRRVHQRVEECNWKRDMSRDKRDIQVYWLRETIQLYFIWIAQTQDIHYLKALSEVMTLQY